MNWAELQLDWKGTTSLLKTQWPLKAAPGPPCAEPSRKTETRSRMRRSARGRSPSPGCPLGQCSSKASRRPSRIDGMNFAASNGVEFCRRNDVSSFGMSAVRTASRAASPSFTRAASSRSAAESRESTDGVSSSPGDSRRARPGGRPLGSFFDIQAVSDTIRSAGRAVVRAWSFTALLAPAARLFLAGSGFSSLAVELAIQVELM
jgi:hypothetical protein